jgi:hypothetical protein
MTLSCQIHNTVASLTIEQTYKNSSDSAALETMYVLPIWSDAVLDSLEATLPDGRVVCARVMARDTAVEKYGDAISQGCKTLMATMDRTDRVVLFVGNLAPGAVITVQARLVFPVRRSYVHWEVIIPTALVPSSNAQKELETEPVLVRTEECPYAMTFQVQITVDEG